jgi:transposase-like protein
MPSGARSAFPPKLGFLNDPIVHLLRNSMDFVSWKDRKPLVRALKGIYRAVDAKAAEQALTAFEASEWGQRYPAIGQSWRRVWSEVVPFFAFPEAVRRIYLYDQRDRGAELKTQAGSQGQRALPQ